MGCRPPDCKYILVQITKFITCQHFNDQAHHLRFSWYLLMYLKHVPIPTLFMNCNWNRRDPCCHVRFCPLVPAWATTIHKFQGFEAGHDENNRSKYLIIDPGYKGWEQLHTGALYVALSRGKNMSNVYWVGHGMCIDRIMDGTSSIVLIANRRRACATHRCSSPTQG